MAAAYEWRRMSGSGRPGLLDVNLTAYRLGDPNGEFPIYDDEGAALYPGRWNSVGVRVIYAAEHYATALLEKLVHLNFILPRAMHWIGISIPAGTSYETFPAHAHSGWDGVSEHICKAYGDAWIRSRRSALLFVPSIPARPDRNVLINRAHPQAIHFSHARPEPVPWDMRLFTPTPAAPAP
jgi:RES domain-containing protein